MRKIVLSLCAAVLVFLAGSQIAQGTVRRADWSTADAQQVILGLWESSDVVTGSGLPITASGCSYRTLLRTAVPVVAGDSLDITANGRVTDDASLPRYPVGVTWNFAYYDADNGLGSSGTWYSWGDNGSQGENVTPDMHHLSLGIDRTLRVPSDWPAGHRAVIVLRACASSTSARSGDVLTVDPLGELIVRRWTAPAPSPGPSVTPV